MNYKKLNKLLLVTALSTSLVYGSNMSKVNAASENSYKQNVNQVVNKETKNSPTSDENCLKKEDGSYFAQLLSKNAGKRDKEFESPSIYEINKYADVLEIKGTLDYNKDPDSTNVDKMLENQTHFFTVSNDTVYNVQGGSVNPQFYDEDEFLKHYDEVKDLGYAINIEVKDGLVTEITIYE